MPEQSQNYATHRRYLPLYHFVVLPGLVANVVFATWHATRIPTRWNIWVAVLSYLLALLGLMARVMALRVQDRLICLEMRLRFARVLPPDLAARAANLPPRQLIALRFAGDRELGNLVERCLSGQLTGQDEIKKAITDWQADWLRA